MQKSNFFALMSRMKYIARWGLMKSTIPENIQEHSLAVSMIAHALAVIGRDIYHKSIDPGFVRCCGNLSRRNRNFNRRSSDAD